MTELSTRQEKILCAIVKDYTKSATPVSSGELGAKFNFPWSTATTRAEMVVLEIDGFIRQPYTSAGRVPTDRGFRYYVNLMENTFGQNKLSRESNVLKKQLSSRSSFEDSMQQAVRALSEVTNMLAVARLPRGTYSHGLSSVLSEPEYFERAEATEFADIVDNIDQLFSELPSGDFNVFIGSEMPFGKNANSAMIISRFRTPDSENAGLAIIGPMRLPYDKIIPLLKYTSRLMEEGHE